MFSGMGKKPTTKLETEVVLRNKRVLEDFVRNADVPKWYRGLSLFQFEAANKLHFAIRDDLEQGTTHRVEALLNRIGLRPTLSKENIRFVMFLSGGNDLAFLWFVKELFYNTDSTDYSVNEQLILSSVARLDLLFTLRGLDRILPPKQPAKYEIRRIELEKQKLAQKKLQAKHRSASVETHTVNSIRIKYKLPYFDDLVRPRLYEHKLTAYPPPYRLNVAYADVLRDSQYVIPNAHNRWFADYNLHPGKRTGMQMLTEKMSEIFKAKTPSRSLIDIKTRFSKNMYKRATTSLHEIINSEHELQKSLCMHHQALANMERTIEHEMRVRAREKCLKYFDAETPKREERIERIRKQIEKDVNAHLIQFKKLTERTRSHLQLWSQDEIREFASNAHNEDSVRLCGGGAQSQSESNIYQRYENCKYKEMNLRSRSEENIRRTTSELTSNESEFYIGDCLMIGMLPKGKCCKGCLGKTSPTGHHKCQNDNISKVQRVREILHRMPCDCGYGYIKNYDYGHSENSGFVGNDPYFRSPDEHHPYMFDYSKVFDLKEKETSRLNIQKEYLKIINSDLNLEKSDPNTPKNLDEAIKRYAKRAFAEGLATESSDSSDPEHLHKQYPFLDIVSDYYDPDDAQLMRRMLKNGLDYLAKDTRYVLASMPDAHKLPSLNTWIEARYGKVYTQESLRKIDDHTLSTIHVLKQTAENVMLPSMKELGNAIYVNYNCRNYLMKKTEMLRKGYYDKVNASIMDQSRTFYLAIKPNLSDNIKNTFFAYMPSREADIQHFRIWRSHEYMPAKEEFFKRNCRAMKLYRQFY